MSEEVFRQADRFRGSGDAVYAALIAAHEGLSDAESAALDARLVLLLAHAVGDLAQVAQATRLARASVRPRETGGGASEQPRSAEGEPS